MSGWIDIKLYWSHLFDFSPFYVFKMPPQIVSLDRCKVALVAFVDFSPFWVFKMPSQIVSLNWCKVALVALVWFFSTVRFQMPPQSASLNWYNITRFSPYSVLREWILKVRQVKSEKNKSLSLFPRSEKWNENMIHSFRELKSEMKMPLDWEVKFLENSREILKNRENSKFCKIYSS